MNYWTVKHQAAIEDFYFCFTAATSATTRIFLFNKILYTPLQHLVKSAIRSINPKFCNDDLVQECLISMFFKTLPQINPNKFKDGFKPVLNLLFISARNFAITQINRQNNIELRLPIDKNYANYSFCENDAETDFNTFLIDDIITDKNIITNETKQEIINEIDRRISEQHIINKASTIWLLNLKNYLLLNDFDERGYREFCINVMNISKLKYSAIASSLHIPTRLLNKNILNE